MKNIIYKIRKVEGSKTNGEATHAYYFDVITLHDEWVERYRFKRDAIADIKERGIYLNDLIKEILSMDNPTDQDIKILRDWLYETKQNFNSGLGMRAIRYLNAKDN